MRKDGPELQPDYCTMIVINEVGCLKGGTNWSGTPEKSISQGPEEHLDAQRGEHKYPLK